MNEVEKVAAAIRRHHVTRTLYTGPGKTKARRLHSGDLEAAQAAIAALDAARGKAEPVAWVYIRKPEEWPPANPVVGLNQWKYDDPARPYWTETPLYAHPPADRVAQVVEWLRACSLSSAIPDDPAQMIADLADAIEQSFANKT